ncbi:MAG: methyl-accepting chemotaxis protein [Oscillospiraceae bacterium]|jgi:methyl-accepting chemotaxis protein|nr:methyl-accepting chemotaxis protein [Oscillospiraceae bacterium]
MKNWKVKTKLLTGFVIMAVLSVIVGVAGIISTSVSIKDSAAIAEYSEVQISMGNVREAHEKICSDLFELSIVCRNNDDSKMNAVLNSLESSISIIDDSFKTYAETAYDEVAEANFYAAKKSFDGEYVSYIRNVMDVSKQTRDSDQAYAAILAGADASDRFSGFLQATVDDNIKWMEEDYNTALADETAARIVPVVVMVIAVAVALFLAFYLSNMISKPLIPLTAFMKKAAVTGDMVIRPSDAEVIEKYGHLRDEIGQNIAACSDFIKRINQASEVLSSIVNGDLTRDINLLSEKDTMGLALHNLFEFFNKMFNEIQLSANQSSNSSKQIADGAQLLAQGSMTQAESVEKLLSSIVEIKEKTKANAGMAQKAAELANAIKSHAERGSRQMGEMIAAVNEINEASKSISHVIKVIDDIAFQTTILALNAAVEAARAGQNGKGFAVVAEEVRNLAAKSAEAANNTGSMIENSIAKANLGVRIAGETAESFAEIVSGIKESDKIVNEIAQSSEEQSHGIEQVNVGVDQVARVIQQNSATAEESAAASEEMSSQAGLLQELVSRFKLKGK